MLKQHTSRFENTIFAINYLCTEQTDVPISEVDRTLQNIQEYKTIIDYANCTHCIPQITKREQIFTPNSVKQKIYVLHNISINTQQILYNFNKKVEYVYYKK